MFIKQWILYAISSFQFNNIDFETPKNEIILLNLIYSSSDKASFCSNAQQKVLLTQIEHW